VLRPEGLLFRAMKIVVFGVGGVGAYFGGRLAEAGEDVVFIARGAHLEAMRSAGLRVDSPQGDFVLNPVNVTDNPAEAGIADVVLLGVKTWQVREAADALKPMLGAKSLVVPLQNGIDTPRVLAEVLGEARVLGGACGIFAYIEGPGHVVHGGVDPYIQFGALHPTSNENIELLCAAFNRAKGVVAEVADDMQASMWQKFLAVAPIGAVGAITRVPMGVMLADPATSRLIEQAKREIWEVGRALGVNWAEDALARVTAQHAQAPPETTASMQRDIMQGRPSELEAQVGAIVKLGGQVGVDTPVNRFIYDCLMPQERRARKDGARA